GYTIASRPWLVPASGSRVSVSVQPPRRLGLFGGRTEEHVERHLALPVDHAAVIVMGRRVDPMALADRLDPLRRDPPPRERLRDGLRPALRERGRHLALGTQNGLIPEQADSLHDARSRLQPFDEPSQGIVSIDVGIDLRGMAAKENQRRKSEPRTDSFGLRPARSGSGSGGVAAIDAGGGVGGGRPAAILG